MSVSLWRWSEKCEGKPCCGDCEECGEEEKMTSVDEIKVGNVERERLMNRQKLREHLVKIGERIIKDAEEINFPSAMTTRMSVIASIAPGEKITEVHYILHRLADPRVPERDDNGLDERRFQDCPLREVEDDDGKEE